MLKISATEVQNNRGKTVRELSKRWGDCHVVLKGHQTMIGRSREDLLVNCSGNPQLAQGGSGDLLAGYLGGLLAQPALQKTPKTAIQYAVWQHGASADLLAATRSVLEDGVHQLADTVRNSLNFYRMQDGAENVERALLTGPAVAIPGFAERLSEQLRIAVEPVVVGVEGEQELDAGRLAVAAGLAVEDRP